MTKIMIWKRFKITDDFNVSVVYRNKKISVCFWSARKGASFKISKQQFMKLLTKANDVTHYIETELPCDQ